MKKITSLTALYRLRIGTCCAGDNGYEEHRNDKYVPLHRNTSQYPFIQDRRQVFKAVERNLLCAIQGITAITANIIHNLRRFASKAA
jgi:hypothetical protein